MKQGIARFASEEEKRSFVAAEDKAFENRLDEAVKSFADDDKVQVILLSGPSGSGKTTASEKISHRFSRMGKRLVFASIDDFYLDKEENKRRALLEGREVEYESARSIDLDALSKLAGEIARGKEGSIPKFSFAEGRRVGYRPVDFSGKPVVLLEGIQAVYPEVERIFENMCCAELFIRPMGILECGGAEFDGNELRLFRRIVRNCLQRGSSAEAELEMWKTVRANEEENIFPNVSERVLCVDSMLGYEINMIKPMISEKLLGVSENSPYAEYADGVLRRLEGIEEISREYLSLGSLFCEFVY